MSFIERACAVYISSYMLRTLGGSEPALTFSVLLFTSLLALVSIAINGPDGLDLEPGALLILETNLPCEHVC